MLYDYNYLKYFHDTNKYLCEDTLYNIINNPNDLNPNKISNIEAIQTDFCFSKNYKVINLDRTSNNIGCKPTPSSMDIVFGIIDNNKQSNVVLIELKFNITKLNNIRKVDLEKKVNDSISTLKTFFRITNIYDKYYFVFIADKIELAKARLHRMYPEINLNFIAIGHKEIETIFFT